MSHPSTLSTNIRPVLRFIPGRTSRTFLGGIGRVYLLYLDTKSLGLVADEGGQLGVAPTILHAVVFAGFRPTTCTCRALADTLQGFDFDRSYPLFMGMVDDLPGKLMVDILHPAGFFALTLFDGTCLLCLLQLLATSLETTAHVPQISSIAKEATALPAHIGDSRYFDA